MQRPQATVKRNLYTYATYTRLDFSTEQEEEIIKFVKSNPPLFNPKDPENKNKKHRDCLWNQIGEKLGKPGEDCKDKWTNIRDNYNKWKGKRLITGTSALFQRRNKLLAFLDETVAVNKRTITNIMNSPNDDGYAHIGDDCITIGDEKVSLNRRQSSSNEEQGRISEISKENSTKQSEIMQKMSSDSKQETGLELFFASICKTVSILSPFEQAKMKMDILNLVSGIELDHIKRMERNNIDRRVLIGDFDSDLTVNGVPEPKWIMRKYFSSMQQPQAADKSFHNLKQGEEKIESVKSNPPKVPKIEMDREFPWNQIGEKVGKPVQDWKERRKYTREKERAELQKLRNFRMSSLVNKRKNTNIINFGEEDGYECIGDDCKTIGDEKVSLNQVWCA